MKIRNNVEQVTPERNYWDITAESEAIKIAETQQMISDVYKGIDTIVGSSIKEGDEYVKQIQKMKDEFNKDMDEYFEQNNIENDTIEFYLSKLYNNPGVYLVISHPVHPTEEQSIDLLFKIIDRIEKDNMFRIKTG
jgi:hypothetical protein